MHGVQVCRVGIGDATAEISSGYAFPYSMSKIVLRWIASHHISTPRFEVRIVYTTGCRRLLFESLQYMGPKTSRKKIIPIH